MISYAIILYAQPGLVHGQGRAPILAETRHLRGTREDSSRRSREGGRVGERPKGAVALPVNISRLGRRRGFAACWPGPAGYPKP